MVTFNTWGADWEMLLEARDMHVQLGEGVRESGRERERERGSCKAMSYVAGLAFFSFCFFAAAAA